MKFFYLLAICLFAFVTAEEKCGNGLFAQDEEIFPLLEKAPIEAPNSFCPTSGDNSCCSEEALDKLEEIFDKAKDALELVEEEFDNAPKPDWDAFKKSIRENPLLNDDQKDATIDLIEKMEDFYDDIVGDVVECGKGLITFIAGMYCFACEANYQDYLSVTSGIIGEQYKIELHEDTCESVADQCEPLYETIVEFSKAVAEYTKALIGDIGGDIDDDFLSNSICGSDESCKDQICSSLLTGYRVALPSPTVLAFSGTGLKRSAALQEVQSIFEKSGIAEKLNNPINKFNGFNQLSKRSVRAILATENEFTDEGYDAYKVGDKSGFDTGGSSAAVAIIIILLIIIAIAIVGVIVWKKKLIQINK